VNKLKFIQKLKIITKFNLIFIFIFIFKQKTHSLDILTSHGNVSTKSES